MQSFFDFGVEIPDKNLKIELQAPIFLNENDVLDDFTDMLDDKKEEESPLVRYVIYGVGCALLLLVCVFATWHTYRKRNLANL